MKKQESKTPIKAGKVKSKKPRKLKRHHVYLLRIVCLFTKLWTRTLRFHLGAEVQDAIANTSSPAIVVAWHNRLFVVPEFYTRYAKDRKLAVIVSASSAGAWLSELFEPMGIKPIRGSRSRRGTQALREMLGAIRSGYDAGITPDGSRGPIYDMKSGAAMLALRAKVPVVLLSYNFKHAWRLSSWDRFYIPFPFSRIEVKMDVIKSEDIPTDENLQTFTETLREKLDAITEDSEYLPRATKLSDEKKVCC